MRSRVHTSGFTLVELLVSMAIFGLLLAVSLGVLNSSSKATRLVVSQTLLQEELRVASMLISDEVRRAYYVFPPCGRYNTAVQLVAFDPACSGAGSGEELKVDWSSFRWGGNTRTPPDDAANWSVGSQTAPILAMIVSPRDSQVTCADSEVGRDGCYTFVAYFPVLRERVTRGKRSNSPTSGALLDDLPESEHTWVLMRYFQSLTEDLRSLGSLDIDGYGVLRLPDVRWGDVGCVLRPVDARRISLLPLQRYCTPGISTQRPPLADPDSRFQETANSLPAMFSGRDHVQSVADIARFEARMRATVAWLERRSSGRAAQIVAEGLAPYEVREEPTSGFELDLMTDSADRAEIDERGVRSLHLRLRGLIVQRGQRTVTPPLELDLSVRNLPRP